VAGQGPLRPRPLPGRHPPALVADPARQAEQGGLPAAGQGERIVEDAGLSGLPALAAIISGGDL
jgi:hypothetical protein